MSTCRHTQQGTRASLTGAQTIAAAPPASCCPSLTGPPGAAPPSPQPLASYEPGRAARTRLVLGGPRPASRGHASGWDVRCSLDTKVPRWMTKVLRAPIRPRSRSSGSETQREGAELKGQAIFFTCEHTCACSMLHLYAWLARGGWGDRGGGSCSCLVRLMQEDSPGPRADTCEMCGSRGVRAAICCDMAAECCIVLATAWAALGCCT